LADGERVVAALPERSKGTIALASVEGFVRTLPAHVVGAAMQPGVALYKHAEIGDVAAAGWAFGDGDIFIATRRGLGIRFPEKALPLAGAVGMRLEPGDAMVSILGVRAESAVLLVSAEGLGTLRLMSGFNPNKSPGGQGKQALKTEQLAAACHANIADDVFILSRLSKIIRFRAEEIPAKEGVVQGVACMALRGDAVVGVGI
jgi:DNA gyrase/topoisomerase IV subunit A